MLPSHFLPASTTKLNILKPIFSPGAAPESVYFYEEHAPNITSHLEITHLKIIRCAVRVVIRVTDFMYEELAWQTAERWKCVLTHSFCVKDLQKAKAEI